MNHSYDPNQYDPNQAPDPNQEDFRRIEAPKKKKKKPADTKTVLMWTLGPLVGLLLLVLVWNLWGPGKKNKKNWSYGYTPVTLTAEQQKAAQKMGEEIAEHLSAGHGDDCHKLTNWEVVINRVEAPMPQDLLAEQDLRKVMNETFSSDSPGLFDPIMQDLKLVDSMFLRMTKRDGYDAALIRCAPTENRVEYYDVLIYPVKAVDNRLQVIDIWDYQTGVYVTDTMRWVGILESGVESETNGQWTAVFGDEAAPHLLKIKDIIKLDANPTQKGTPAANAIKELPASLQNHPAIYAMNVRALRNSYDKDPSAERTNQYINLLANPVTQDKNKPMPFALMAEIYHKQNMIKECDEAITNAHKQMKDGYLKFQLAKWRLGRGDIPGAETAYGQAKMEAPGIKALFVFGKKLEEKKASP